MIVENRSFILNAEQIKNQGISGLEVRDIRFLIGISRDFQEVIYSSK